MNGKSDIPDALREFTDRLREGLRGCKGALSMVRFLRPMFSELSLNAALFRDILRSIKSGGPYPDISYPTMFDSEIILFNDPERFFTVRLFIWGPGQYDPVHDHSSWGVIGPVSGDLDVVNYERVDDGKKAGHAVLRETERMTISPGENYYVLPLNGGIHKTGNPSGETIVQVSIYGRPTVKRDFINGYDPDQNRVFPIYAPKTKKKILAADALRHFDRT